MSYTAKDFLTKVAMGQYSNIVPWVKIGYNPSITNAEEDLWSAGGAYVFCQTAGVWEVVSSDDAADKPTTLHSGADTTGGSTTTLQKTGENFLTTTAAGDAIIVDAGGTTPEWGIITAVDSDTQITFANGLSEGGSGASRATYAILDKSATAGAHAVIVTGLNASYAEQTEIAILNGTTAVDLTKTWYRVNGFNVICAGTNEKPTGALTLRADGGGTTYSYIIAGFTRARNQCYTIPAAKTLYVVEWNAGWNAPNDTKVQSARFFTRANVEPTTKFRTNNLFYPYTEIMLANQQISTLFPTPTMLPAKTDIRVTAIATDAAGAGPATSVLRGFLVS